MEVNLPISFQNDSRATGNNLTPEEMKTLFETSPSKPKEDIFVQSGAPNLVQPSPQMSTIKCHAPNSKPPAPINLKFFQTSSFLEQKPTQDDILKEVKRLHKQEGIELPALLDVRAILEKVKKEATGIWANANKRVAEILEKILQNNEPETFIEMLEKSIKEEEDKLAKLNSASRDLYTQRKITDELKLIDSSYKEALEENKESELLVDRANHNLTHDSNYLTKHLPIKRNLLKLNPKKIEDYEKLVKLIMEKSRMCYKPVMIDDMGAVEQLKNAKPLDASTSYMVAASIVELFHNRPDVINFVLGKKDKLNIILTGKIIDSDGKDPGDAGFYKSVDNSIVITKFWDSILIDRSNYIKPKNTSTVQHEFVHAVDRSGMWNHCDGIPHRITDAQKERFIKIRDELIKKFEDKSLSNKERFSGLAKQAFDRNGNNYKEFITYAAGEFYHSPECLKYSAPRLYNWLVEYFRFDPMDLKGDELFENALPISKEEENALISAFKSLEKGAKVTLVKRSGRESTHIVDSVYWDKEQNPLSVEFVDGKRTKGILFIDLKEIKNIKPPEKEREIVKQNEQYQNNQDSSKESQKLAGRS